MAEPEATKDGPLRRWIRATFGESAEPLPGLSVGPLPGLTVGNEQFESLLLCRGPGSEPGEFDAELFSMQRFVVDPDESVRWGTAPVSRGPDEALGLRLTDRRMVWMPHALVPTVLPVPNSSSEGACNPNNAAPTNADAEPELDAAALARKRRLERHPQMRALIAALSKKRFGSQAELARHMQLKPGHLSEYQTGMARSKRMSSDQLKTRHRELTRALQRHG